MTNQFPQSSAAGDGLLPVTLADRQEFVRRHYARGRFYNEAGNAAINNGLYDDDPEMQAIAKRRSTEDARSRSIPAAADRLAKALQAGRDVVHGRGTGTYHEATDAIHLLLAAVPGAISSAAGDGRVYYDVDYDDDGTGEGRVIVPFDNETTRTRIEQRLLPAPLEGVREAIERVETALSEAERFEAPADGISYGDKILRFSDIRTLLALLTSRPDGVASIGSRPSAVQASDRRIAARTYAAIIAPEPVDIAGFMSGKFDKSDIVKAFVEHRSMESAPLLSFDHCRDFWPTGDVFNRLGAWLSAALDDPNTGEAFKADIRAWLEVGGDRMPLTAAPSESVGDWVLVPRKPTEAMLGVGYCSTEFQLEESLRPWDEMRKAWSAMLTAAPKSGEVGELREVYWPCPTCGQYSHTVGGDLIAEAVLHFETMFSHRGDGIPTQHMFDEKTRDMAQRLAALAKDPPTNDGEIAEVEALGEALFAMSAQLKASGFLADPAHRAVYERVIAAFSALAPATGEE